MRSLRLPVAPYHSSFTWIGGVTPAVTRLSVTSGVGPVVPAFLPALHLDEDPHVAVAADEVDLTVPELDVPRDDAQAGTLEEARRGFFRRAPEEVTGVAHASDRGRAGGR